MLPQNRNIKQKKPKKYRPAAGANKVIAVATA
jgi:hypothetical protein